jgi:methyl-accepting chemotaxis protein
MTTYTAPNSPPLGSAIPAGMIDKVHRRFVSLRTKLLLTFTALFVAMFGASYYWFYTYVTNLAMTRITTDLTNIVKTAADGIDGDEMVALYREGQPNAAGFSDDPRYLRQIEWLDRIHKIDPRAWPYTYVQGATQNDIFYIVDLWSRYEASKSTKFKEAYVSKGAMLNGFRTFHLHAEKPYTDKWGTWISAYAPVRNKAGEIVGAIGVDYEQSYVDQVQRDIRTTVGIGSVALLIVLFGLVYVMSRALTQPIGRLTAAARQVGEGKYELNFAAISRTNLRDEITLLAEVFTSMAAKIYQREQSLIRKVEELKIEIDEAKRQKQVDEIVESDFFQDLQAKAKSMRRRSS